MATPLNYRTSIFDILAAKSVFSVSEIQGQLERDELEFDCKKVKPYLLPYIKNDLESIVSFGIVDSEVYRQVKEILQDNELGKHCDAICSILKQGYDKMCLARLYSEKDNELVKNLINELIQSHKLFY